MALQMNMRIDGVTGDSKSYEYRDWSEIVSWNWGMTSNRKSTRQGDSDRTSLNELSVVKPVGSDSPAIRLLFAQGKSIATVEFSVTPVVGKREAQTKYVFMRLEDAVIKSVVAGGGVDDSFFREHITLLFDRVRFEYSRNVPGQAGHKGTSVDFGFGWNVPSNEEWQTAPK